ncbi:MAG: cobalt ECF transporter T component CbiQ [Vallitaleaceae bacterium]|nr:cobalt ECF transporter T component CbiQ [Vallitaleaceae bacterium]
MNIDQYAYRSKLKNINTLLKIYFSFASIFVCLWSKSFVTSIFLLLLMGTLTVFKGQIPSKVFIRLLTLPMVFLVVGILGIAISYSPKQVGFYQAYPIFNGYFGFTIVGVERAIVLFFKALGATSCMYFLILNTPMVALLSAFKKLKVPKLLVELMELMYRFILIFMDTADNIYTAQKSRCGYTNIPSSYRSLGGLASVLFIRSYKRSEEMFRALEARGYNGELNVLEESTERNVYLFVVVTVFLVVLIGINFI